MRIAEFTVVVILIIIGSIALFNVYRSWKNGEVTDGTIWAGVIATAITVPALYKGAWMIDGHFRDTSSPVSSSTFRI